MKISHGMAASRGRRERAFTGTGVSPGIAIGTAHVVESAAVDVPEYRIPKSAAAAECTRFTTAVAKSRDQLQKLADKAFALHGNAAEELGYLLDAHLQMLSSSRLIRGVEDRITRDRINAEAAVSAEVGEIVQTFADMQESYLAARGDDVREVGARLIRNLTRTPYKAFSGIEEGAVVIAENLSPSDTALMDPRRVAGFATAVGGAEGHTAIMARALGLPAVLGVPGLVSQVRSGDVVVIDGDSGRLIVNPSADTVAEYRRRRAGLLRQRRDLARLRDLPAVTRDGVGVCLLANIDLPVEVEQAIAAGAAGVGLLRSEFMYMNRPTLPDEDEQCEALREVVEGMGGRPVTIRTLDVGGDKLAASLGDQFGGSINPALGLRAIRLSLAHKRLLEVQLAAMLRAGVHGPIRILLPLITTTSEVADVRRMLSRVARRLKRQGRAIADPLPPVGAMVETPAAALAADSLAHVCEFLSIGTNDLTMYTLAVDRGDLRVAHLYDPLHQSVLRLVQFTTAAASRQRIPANLCGEMAGDMRNAALLLGLGLTELSMAPASIAKVKKRIRSLEFGASCRLAQKVMAQSDSIRIGALLEEFDSTG